ncbi:MAG TPA: crossover junction endodeoxyribonuclease RuvC [Rhodospirillales bacterium]|nr:crossover junction endodeoxyribonuclease RuvC [Rhodospirillales bacterium]
MRLIGFDPGLRNTGWGVIEANGNHLGHIADGVVKTDAKLPLADRLVQLQDGLTRVIEQFHPDEAAVEETFVNKNAASTLKLGQARAISLLVPANGGLKVFEYSPNLIKKSVVGGGHAAKQQIKMMVKVLLPGAELKSADAADALAVAICHAHHRDSVQTRAALGMTAMTAGESAGETGR